MDPIPFLLKNLFLQVKMPIDGSEFSQELFSGKIRLEQIISTGQITPDNDWYNQAVDEWVLLIQGNAILCFSNGAELKLIPGDHLIIPAHQLHRVIYTSADPPCLWIAIHGSLI